MGNETTGKSGLTKDQTRSSLASFTWNLSLRGVFDTICGGTTFVFVGFALALGMPREHMGFVTSVSSLACILQIVSLPLLSRTVDKRRFVISLALAEPLYFAVPYYQVFHLTVARMPESLIAYMSVGYYLTKLLALPALGRHLDRVGPRRMVYLVSPLYVLFFFCFLFSHADRVWPLMTGWALVGIADGAFTVAITSALYATVSDGQGRPAYFAVYNILTLGMYAVSGSLAVPLLNACRNAPLRVAGCELGHFQVFYGILAAVMVPCVFATQLLPCKGGAR